MPRTTVTVDSLREVTTLVGITQDTDAEVVFEADRDDLLLLRILLHGDLPLGEDDNVDAWWNRCSLAVRNTLRAFLADPPPPVDGLGGEPGDCYVVMPIPRVVLGDPEFDVVAEILPEIKEAFKTTIEERRRLP